MRWRAITAVPALVAACCVVPVSVATAGTSLNGSSAPSPRGTPLDPAHATTARVRATVSARFAVGRRTCYRPLKGDPNQFWVVCDHRVPHGYKRAAPGPRTLLIDLRFVARRAANDRHVVYEYSLGRASAPSCQSPAGVSGTTMDPIRAGQHVVVQDFEAPCPGVYRGLVTYQRHGGPGRDTLFWDRPIQDGSVLVGRFHFRVR